MSNDTTYHLDSIATALEQRLPDRRERIATAAMVGLLANNGAILGHRGVAEEAVAYADALIAALDANAKPDHASDATAATNT